ncbi:hypothetical protein [Pseudomonas nitroreducens]|uniref:hypothetical protein n=1 Tax=Pseudomonas nitroreducens TaxID=46680 RepID=UPI0020A197A5|nr:hypothetical protein [Pseudomonas nitroreducens]MCP1626461.1 hypothetical protein [Pseudomonas nitroreducens]
MRLKALSAALLIGATLAGCNFPSQVPQAKATTPVNWVKVPTLLFIEDAVLSLSPSFQGKRAMEFMPLICGLARGEVSQIQVNARLAGMGINVDRIPRQSQDASALLVNTDRAAQATACAAFQAAAVLTAADPQEFYKAAPSAGKSADKATEESPAARQLDTQLLSRMLPIRIAQSRANAEVFALIARDLQGKPGLSPSQYQERARELFGRLAPSYLALVPARMPGADAKFQLLHADADRLEFISNTGVHYDFSVDKGLVLTQKGVLWYGRGKLLGNDYRVPVAYFQPQVAQLLNAAKR